jgi:hypothetical protein
VANAISNDNIPAHQVLEQRKPDAKPGGSSQPAVENGIRPPDDNADISRAHQLLSQESGAVREAAIPSEREARQRLALLKELMSESPKAAMKSHGNMNVNAFEAAMARPSG